MPGFVKTPKDEARWSKAKEAAAKTTEHGSEGFWKLSNFIFHKMDKSEESQKIAEELKKGLMGLGGGMGMAGGGMGLGMTGKSGMGGVKIAQTSVKMAKPKKPAGAMSKPSLFYKNESLSWDDLKHPTLCKLSDFILKKHKK
jgi:hypothetical protein